jgi:hypothetical protein
MPAPRRQAGAPGNGPRWTTPITTARDRRNKVSNTPARIGATDGAVMKHLPFLKRFI